MRGSREPRAARPEVPPPKRREIAARLRAGARVKDLAAEFGCHAVTVWRIGTEAQLRRRRVEHSLFRLRFEERERISRGIAAGESARQIARDLGRAP
jgi:transposase, IS30 family